jgi:hypothetical protein
MVPLFVTCTVQNITWRISSLARSSNPAGVGDMVLSDDLFFSLTGEDMLKPDASSCGVNGGVNGGVAFVRAGSRGSWDTGGDERFDTAVEGALFFCCFPIS